MENGGISSDQRTMISSFLEIAIDQSDDTAKQFLQATGWKLEEAIQLFYAENEFGDASSSPYIPPPEYELLIPYHQYLEPSRFGVSPHEPHTTVSCNNFDKEFNHPGVWGGGADQGSTSAAETSEDNIASLYRPPFALLYHGPFEKAKEAAKGQDRWLIVNVQSTREFSSHMLNRDTWGNEAVAQTITSNFIFWQVYDDTEEGCKISRCYKLDSVPVTFVIDPITDQQMYLWRGMVQPESLLEGVLQFMDSSPKDHHFSLSHKHPRESSHASPSKIKDEINKDDDEMKLGRALSMATLEDIKEVPKEEKRNYPPLPKEPKGDKSLLCRVGVRLPDGSRVQRNFLRSDPIQLLWSFCAAKCGDEKSFRLSHAIPGAMKDMDCDSTLTFDDCGVANSMISVTWE